MIDALFPREVVTVGTVEVGSQEALYPEERAYVRRAVFKRQREFATGRTCARAALARLGVAGVPLLAGPDRAPIWPPGFVGSISHCDGYCGVAVARRGHILGLGLDVERTGALQADMTELICTPAEIRRAKAQGVQLTAHWLTLLFSAKEAVYKCYYPLTRTALDFHDVEIWFALDRGSFAANVVRDGVPKVLGGAGSLHGRVTATRTHLFSGVTLTGSEQSTVARRDSPDRVTMSGERTD